MTFIRRRILGKRVIFSRVSVIKVSVFFEFVRMRVRSNSVILSLKI